MSWPIFISKTPVDQLEEAAPEPLGQKEDIVEKITNILPTVQFDDSNWASFQGEEFSISLRLDDEQEGPRYLMLHIRGNGESSIVIIREICEQLSAFAMDGNTGRQMNFDDVDRASLKAWRAYRDKVLNLGKGTSS